MSPRQRRTARSWLTGRPVLAVIVVVAAVSTLAALVAGPLTAPGRAGAVAHESLFASPTPAVVSASDDASVELGVKFQADRDGGVYAIRFYKGPYNQGPHTGALWDSAGAKLASVTFDDESPSGWQTAYFPEPVAIEKGKTYTASYQAPAGRYSVDVDYFQKPFTEGALTVPAGGGVHSYGASGFPTETFRDSNYYVDVIYRAGELADSLPAPAPSASPSPSAEEPAALDLPRIPWEGGPAYWKQFSKTDAAGWDDPDFFPIISWWGNVSSDEDVAYDTSLGINTYSQMWEGTPYRLFEDNNVFWIGGKLNSSFSDDSANWVGHFLDDEVDGRFSPAQGQARLESIVESLADDGRFRYANYTQMVVGTDLDQQAAKRYVNDFTDVVSVDKYWYTVPYCDWRPYRDVYLSPVSQENCRTASSYGKMLDSLRIRDAADGRLQPLWQWVENLNGGGTTDSPSVYITPGQLKGAVMNSIINEARGIAYFNQSLNGPCQSSNVFRDSQLVPDFCGAAQVQAVKEVNATIRSLASVINTQSYEYSFGAGLDTMLKTRDGFAYVFAMVDGSSKPGMRTFQLPPGVNGTSVDVLGENRSLDVDGKGRFSDAFDDEYSYHIYRIELD